jgi:hypothetical protein
VKITMNVDCTPEEARAFLSLPDLKPMQDELMQEMRNRLMACVAAMDPAEILRTWMPAMTGLEQMQDFLENDRRQAGRNDRLPCTLRRLPPVAASGIDVAFRRTSAGMPG